MEEFQNLFGEMLDAITKNDIGRNMISKIKNAVVEIKKLDNILTKINETSDMTAKGLKELGVFSYGIASKYGRTASDYLSGVESMAKSGFYGEKGAVMAEQSMLAQAAGDMSQDIADKYIIATNAAYKFNGVAEKINAVLDGQNNISKKNGIAFEDMAVAMSEAGEAASGYNVAVRDLSAMTGTIETVTKSGGFKVGNSIKVILDNLQNVTSDKVTNTLNKANISMTEMVNGAEKLRNPIEIVRDLAKAFNELDSDAPLRKEILINIAGENNTAELSSLLQNMETFDKMLSDYSGGAGSAIKEASKSAESLTGSLNTLSNSWTEFINSFVGSDELKAGANFLNGLVNGATDLVNILTPLGTISLGAGLFAGIKNVGGLKFRESYFEYA